MGNHESCEHNHCQQRGGSSLWCWESLPLETRLVLCKRLREAVPCDGAEGVQRVLLVCEPSADALAHLSQQAALQAKGFLPDACAPPNIMASSSSCSAGSIRNRGEDVEEYRVQVVEAAILAVFHPYMRHDGKNGVCPIPGIFVLPGDATVGQLKARIRRRYLLGTQAVVSAFFEENAEGHPASMVLPLDSVKLADVCVHVHEDGFVRVPLVVEGI